MAHPRSSRHAEHHKQLWCPQLLEHAQRHQARADVPPLVLDPQRARRVGLAPAQSTRFSNISLLGCGRVWPTRPKALPCAQPAPRGQGPARRGRPRRGGRASCPSRCASEHPKGGKRWLMRQRGWTPLALPLECGHCHTTRATRPSSVGGVARADFRPVRRRGGSSSIDAERLQPAELLGAPTRRFNGAGKAHSGHRVLRDVRVPRVIQHASPVTVGSPAPLPLDRRRRRRPCQYHRRPAAAVAATRAVAVASAATRRTRQGFRVAAELGQHVAAMRRHWSPRGWPAANAWP